MIVVWDDQCPSGHIYWLTPEFWFWEILAGANMEMADEWIRKDHTEEGGGWYRWNNAKMVCRMGCGRYDLQIKGTGFTAG